MALSDHSRSDNDDQPADTMGYSPLSSDPNNGDSAQPKGGLLSNTRLFFPDNPIEHTKLI